jgi:hypothetical protein
MPINEKEKCKFHEMLKNCLSFSCVSNVLIFIVSQSIFEFIKTGKVEELEDCVKRGASINEIEKTRDKFSPLHCAAYYGSLEVSTCSFDIL